MECKFCICHKHKNDVSIIKKEEWKAVEYDWKSKNCLQGKISGTKVNVSKTLLE